MAAERDISFWKGQEICLSNFEPHWRNAYVSPDEEEGQKLQQHGPEDYSMGGSLDDHLEKVVGNRTDCAIPRQVVVIPRQVAKLCRGRTCFTHDLSRDTG